jgi:hypothetical protein
MAAGKWIYVGAFWKAKSGRGLSGTIDEKAFQDAMARGKLKTSGESRQVFCSLFKNDKGGNPRRPDYQIAVAIDEDRQQETNLVGVEKLREVMDAPAETEDDLPF